MTGAANDGAGSGATPSPLPSAWIRKVAALLQANEDPDARAFGAGLLRYVDGVADGLTFEAALGLISRPNAWRWVRLEALRVRDDMIRAYAQKHHPEGSVASRARAVKRDLVEYEATSWSRDRRNPGGPASRNEAVHERYRILRQCTTVGRESRDGSLLPTDEKQFERIIRRGGEPDIGGGW